jgi:hypothetical protein
MLYEGQEEPVSLVSYIQFISCEFDSPRSGKSQSEILLTSKYPKI